jgi:hypothetical protein
MSEKRVRRAIERDPDFRALRICDKYLFRVCTPRMRKATLDFLISKHNQLCKASELVRP